MGLGAGQVQVQEVCKPMGMILNCIPYAERPRATGAPPSEHPTRMTAKGILLLPSTRGRVYWLATRAGHQARLLLLLLPLLLPTR